MSAAFMILPVAVMWMLLAPSTVTPSQALEPPPKIVAPVEPGAPRPDVDLQDSDGIVDLYGNEVSDAIA